MQYMILIHEDESYYSGDGAEEKLQQTIAGHDAMIAEMVKQGIEFSGHRLADAEAATTIKWDNGTHVVHDGPFAETHEELGGYYIIDVANLDEALHWAKKIPIPGKGTIELRPVWQD